MVTASDQIIMPGLPYLDLEPGHQKTSISLLEDIARYVLLARTDSSEVRRRRDGNGETVSYAIIPILTPPAFAAVGSN